MDETITPCTARGQRFCQEISVSLPILNYCDGIKMSGRCLSFRVSICVSAVLDRPQGIYLASMTEREAGDRSIEGWGRYVNRANGSELCQTYISSSKDHIRSTTSLSFVPLSRILLASSVKSTIAWYVPPPDFSGVNEAFLIQNRVPTLLPLLYCG